MMTQNSIKMMATPQNRRSMRKRRINRAAKNQRKEEGNDYSKPIIKYGSTFNLGHRNRTLS